MIGWLELGLDAGRDSASDSRLERFYNYVDEIYREQLRLLYDEECRNQPWTLVERDEILKVLRPYMKRGFVPEECKEALEGVRCVFIENAVKIKFNTEMMNHTCLDPREIVEAYGFEWRMNVDVKLCRWCSEREDGLGHWRLSDSCDNKLLNKAAALYAAKDDEEKVQCINEMMQFVHRRGVLTSWFVRGGAVALDEISNS
jgi:hypothetical protein